MKKNGHIYSVEGMHCASCEVIIKKEIEKLPGVRSVQINFATEKAVIDHDLKTTTLATINAVLDKFGYALRGVSGSAQPTPADRDNHPSHESEVNFQETRVKMQFVVPLALFVFAVMLWDTMAQTFISIPNLPIPMALFELSLMVVATIVMFWVGKPFITGVVRFVRYRVANMDTLIGIGTLTAYIYSTAIVLLPTVREYFRLPEYTYFDVVIVVIGFVVLGKYLEARSKERTGEAMRKLVGLQAKSALVIRAGREVEIPLTEVRVGDLVVVKPGGKIPVDGIIRTGSTAIDESMISGESIPVDKVVGDTVIGATINKHGAIEYEATRVGEDTMLAEIIKMVELAQGSRAPIQALADRVSRVFVPTVLTIAFLALGTWLFIAPQFIGTSAAISFGILSFVGVLVIACPCALGLATPTAIIVGVGKGAERGILVKDAESLERLSQVDTVVMDKTGTITTGKPEVTDVISVGSLHKDDLLRLAASVEQRSEHPLAAALVLAARQRSLSLDPVSGFVAQEGVGVEGVVEEQLVRVAKPHQNEKTAEILTLEQQGKTVVSVRVDNVLGGYIALADTLKTGVKEAVSALKARGIDVMLLSGDNERAVKYIAQEAGIDTVMGEVLPKEKADKISALKAEGRVVAMVGDGVNDAPALMTAQVGIAMATGTDVALESAGITLLHGDVTKVADAIVLARRTLRTVKQNLFWAFFYNVIGIPIAAGALYPLWGIILNPIFAGLAMAGSSVSVVLNALRLKWVR